LQSQTKLGDSVEHAWDEHSFVGVSARYGCRCHVPKPIGVTVILTCARAENPDKAMNRVPLEAFHFAKLTTENTVDIAAGHLFGGKLFKRHRYVQSIEPYSEICIIVMASR
jgi:hypothetical protein